MTRRVLGLFLLACVAPRTLAHDFWIEPSSFYPEASKRFTVGLRVGDHFKGEPVPRSDARTVRFVVAGPDGESPIPGRNGDEPAGTCRLTRPGVYTLGFQSNHAFVELEAAKFDEYLKEKGLDAILAQRRERRESDRKVREAYSRCAKALIRVNPDVATDASAGGRTLGFPLELIEETDMTVAIPGAKANFRLRYDGKPLPGALVTATHRELGDEKKLSARTAADGLVTFQFDQPGVWLIAAVHMIRAPDGVGHEWESFWASLTFELRAPASGTAPKP